MLSLDLSGIYCGAPPMPAEIWLRWNLDPVLLAETVVALLRADAVVTAR